MTASALLPALPAIATALVVVTGTAQIDLGRSAALEAQEQGSRQASVESGHGLDALVAGTEGSCLNLRPAPGTAEPALACVPDGTRLTLIESAPGWKKARLGDGRQGWVAAEYLRVLSGDRTEPSSEVEPADEPESRQPATQSPAVRVSEAELEHLSAGEGDAGHPLVVLESAEPCLNFRSNPSSASEVFECLEPGTILGSVGRFEGWRYVELKDNRAGWVAAQYVGPIGMGGGDGRHF